MIKFTIWYLRLSASVWESIPFDHPFRRFYAKLPGLKKLIGEDCDVETCEPLQAAVDWCAAQGADIIELRRIHPNPAIEARL